jgi:hypothetical protein
MRTAFVPLSSALVITAILSACNAAIPYDDGNQVQFVPDDTATSEASSVVTPQTTPVSCPPLNADAPNGSVTYKSVAYGISFPVPSNERWGSPGNPMPAYEEHGSMDVDSEIAYVDFGAPVVFTSEDTTHDCTPEHSYMLTILPARSAEATASSVEGADSPITPTTQTRVINGLTVVQYVAAGSYPNPTMEVMGTKYNYRFSTTYGSNSADEWQALENIVKTVKLTK